NPELLEAFRHLDVNVNVNWPLAHYKTAVAYLHKNPEDIAATGGTNWQKYLPPRFQKRMFFPTLWTDAEKEEWGKQWVKKYVFNQ
ncbi:MAG TPA: tryptophan 2,3-dioxygenase, partial [Bacteroidia bacterium]|nr:tryptophan 2,3-dioxygenase [Bacteroidia bacterium]